MNELIEKAVELFKDSVDDSHSPISEFNIYSRQARACFTAWAIVNGVDADTAKCDEITAYILSNSLKNARINQNDFEGFLYADIV